MDLLCVIFILAAAAVVLAVSLPFVGGFWVQFALVAVAAVVAGGVFGALAPLEARPAEG